MEQSRSKSSKNNNSDKVQDVGYAVHSQVRKIKQESSNYKIMDWPPGQPEVRPILREITRQVSRSPLGLACRPISVGDS